ncbi:NtaA/DmoA family FMN-dependent monooxygenase [Frondihabitans australicus]|uniref:FMN-dependent oxidoreductase (Nitrilotriacetate monooxygenase family) n=1 Tax=Frondihabitans australicus TaxID=386892 RepID=A0A495ICC4_9MICO|nr:NtaA/DmoA family FMN-dependent monooxygenase [Frondihabitans australicus]RKR73569.1 FMN-dependent oxidoreductase (nitrilotriacetate monooxygenase family) [Frondihabitans australicus]
MVDRIVLGAFHSMNATPKWYLADDPLGYLDLARWISRVQAYEKAGLDFVFFADSYGYPVLDGHVIPRAIERAIQTTAADPTVMLAAIAAATESIGLVTTVSTTVEKPQMVARKFATLDHLTKGRVGWNIVTGSGQAASAMLFGEEVVAHDRRYDRAQEHVELSLKLWEGSWEDDALRVDRGTGTFADPALVHEMDHDGEWFASRGILTVPPSPQRTPVLFQAGTSGRGRQLAADFAETVFLSSEPDATAAQIADIRARLEANGRGRDAIRFLPAGTFFVAPTREEAEAKRAAAIGTTSLEDAAVAYAYYTGLDLMSMDLDKPLATTTSDQGQTNIDRFSGADGAPAPTVREILEEFRANSVMTAPFVGTPDEVADEAVAYLDATGADGFVLQPDPSGAPSDFLEHVLPILRDRGLIRAQEPGLTFREQLFGAGRPRLPETHPGAGYRRAPVTA